MRKKYDQMTKEFRWRIPEFYNIGVDVCDRHADGTNKPALLYDSGTGLERYSFDDLCRRSNQFANVLAAQGMSRGDRIAVFLAQSPATAIAHIAAFKSGMISVPLFMLFGDDALKFRLADSGARAIVTDTAGASKLARIRDELPALKVVYVTEEDPGHLSHKLLWDLLEKASDNFTPVSTRADDPAILIYTSGTTGNPKGALHAHRVLLGHLPSIELIHDFFPQPGDLHWSPADWAWIAGLFDVLFPSWHHGVPLLAQKTAKFDPDAAMALMARFSVRNTFLPPTALKMLRQANVAGGQVTLRSMLTGGEALGAELLDWCKATFGIAPHEAYGQTECNVALGNNASLFPIRSGSMGKTFPGFDVRILDDAGQELSAGQQGMIGVRSPHPIMMLEYWKNPDATRDKFANGYLMTGDLGRVDDDGYFWYVSRTDDLIKSAGFRIGPSEIEDCLIKHPAVAMAGVVGIPDPIRTEAVKAWLVLRKGYPPSDALTREIQDFVKGRLASHEYPRHIAFVDELPLTATGKVIRRELRARG
jgi:acetyl-CoA synthetase